MNRPPRLQDLADRAGVSRATVSLALRDHPSISAATRDRIRRLAEEMGYRPNPLVAALMSHQRMGRTTRPTHLSLAFLLQYSRRGGWESYVSPSLLAGAARRARQLGYRLEEYWLEDLGWSDERLSEVLYERSVPGVLVAPLPTASGELSLDWDRFCAVAIGYSLAHPSLHRVTSDRYHAMRLAVRRLRDRGYHRLGLALEENQDALVHHQWAAAFAWEQQQAPAADRVPIFLARDSAWSLPRFTAWYRRYHPEVVLGYDTAIVDWLRGLGCSLPQDVGFVQLWKRLPRDDFAGLYHNPPAIGAAAVDDLVSLIQRNERGLPVLAHTLQLEATWVDGATVRGPATKRVAARTGRA